MKEIEDMLTNPEAYYNRTKMYTPNELARLLNTIDTSNSIALNEFVNKFVHQSENAKKKNDRNETR